MPACFKALIRCPNYKIAARFTRANVRSRDDLSTLRPGHVKAWYKLDELFHCLTYPMEDVWCIADRCALSARAVISMVIVVCCQSECRSVFWAAIEIALLPSDAQRAMPADWSIIDTRCPENYYPEICKYRCAFTCAEVHEAFNPRSLRKPGYSVIMRFHHPGIITPQRIQTDPDAGVFYTFMTVDSLFFKLRFPQDDSARILLGLLDTHDIVSVPTQSWLVCHKYLDRVYWAVCEIGVTDSDRELDTEELEHGWQTVDIKRDVDSAKSRVMALCQCFSDTPELRAL